MTCASIVVDSLLILKRVLKAEGGPGTIVERILTIITCNERLMIADDSLLLLMLTSRWESKHATIVLYDLTILSVHIFRQRRPIIPPPHAQEHQPL